MKPGFGFSCLWGVILALGLASSDGVWAVEAVGRLAEAQGRVEINGAAAPAGAELRLGMRVTTGAESQAVLQFVDGQVVALKPESVFWIKEYRYARQSGENRSVTELLKGGMRYLSGAIAKEQPEAVRIDTPIATIGVRGTEFSAVLGSLCLSTDQGTVLVTGAGQTVAVRAGQILFMRNANTPPTSLPIPELRALCAAPRRPDGPSAATLTTGCACLKLLQTVPGGPALNPPPGAGAAASASSVSKGGIAAAVVAATTVGVIIAKQVREEDSKASPE